ncbi:MMPL family transporter [Candidatus Sumerlaeota bacterium]|nr:MMPL family transporter [Candidatus Sumerlaeota bacterium]
MNSHEPYPKALERSIRRRILRAIGVHLYRHPIWAAMAIAALTVLAVRGGRRLEVSSDLRAFALPDEEERRAWAPVFLTHAENEPLVAIVRFDAPLDLAQTNRAVETLVRVWPAPGLVGSIRRIGPMPSVPTDVSMGEMLRALRPGDLNELETLASRDGAARALALARRRVGTTLGEPRARGTGLSSALTDPTGFFDCLEERVRTARSTMRRTPLGGGVQGDRTLVFLVEPVRSASEISYSLALRDHLERTFGAVREGRESLPAGARLELRGEHVDTARMADRTRTDMVRSLGLALLCVALLLILAFRKVESILFVWTPPILGLVWTYGLVSCFTSRLDLLSAVLPFLLVALGVEFSVQIYYRFVEELYRENLYYPALGAAYSEAGRGVFVATVATALVFLSLYLTSYRSLRELAMVGGLGILSMAVASLSVLPPMAAIKSRLARGQVRGVELYDFGQRSLSAAVIVSPRVCLALALIVTAYLAFFTDTLRVNREIGLDLRGAPSAQRLAGGDSPSLPPSSRRLSILLEAPDLESALARNDRLYANLVELEGRYRPERIDSLSSVLPSQAIQETIRARLADSRRFNPEEVLSSLRAAARSAHLDSVRFDPFVKRLGELRAAAASEPLRTVGDATSDPETLRALGTHIAHSDGVYRVRTTLYAPPENPNLLTDDFAEFQRRVSRALGDGPIHYRSLAIENRRVSRAVIRSLALAVVLSILSLMVCLVPHFRWRLADAMLAALPVVCAAVWTFGLLGLLHHPVSLHALLIFPLVVGVAVDQTILFIQRLYDRRYATLRQVARAGGRPNVVSVLILAIGFGSLAQVRFAALREMATVALIAVALSTLATLIVVPAILQIRQEGGLAAWTDFRDEE